MKDLDSIRSDSECCLPLSRQTVSADAAQFDSWAPAQQTSAPTAGAKGAPVENKPQYSQELKRFLQ